MLLAGLALTTATSSVVVMIAQIVLALLLVAAGIHVTHLLHDAVPSTVRAGVASGVGAMSWIVFLPFALTAAAASAAVSGISPDRGMTASLHSTKPLSTLTGIWSGSRPSPGRHPGASPLCVDHERSGPAMLMRTDPFRELDRLTQQVLGTATGTWSRPTAMPMDAYRAGDEFVVAFDLPGVAPDAIDLDVERNVLTVRAERRPTVSGEQVEMQVAERPLGMFSRQLFLGDSLDTEHIQAAYEAGVLTLRIPVAEQAKPRKIAITGADEEPRQINA
jgi:HSP20 family protein